MNEIFEDDWTWDGDIGESSEVTDDLGATLVDRIEWWDYTDGE